MPILLLIAILLGAAAGASASEPSRDRLRLETLIAGLTDDRPSVFRPAIHGLIDHGPEALSDLEVLAKDPDPRLRARVAQVAGGIGGERAARLLALLIADRHLLVRQTAALALGAVGGEGAYELLRPLLA